MTEKVKNTIHIDGFIVTGKKATHCNPMSELINRLTPVEIRMLTLKQKENWLVDMKELYAEAKIPNPTLKRTVAYLKYCKDVSTTGAYELLLEKTWWNWILAAENMSENLQKY